MQDIIAEIIKTEGGYVNDPEDSGGETRYGITKGTAYKYGYTGDMKNFPIAMAREIYRDRYLIPIHYDALLEIDQPVADKLADMAVNLGQKAAGRMLQRSLNSLNDSALNEDGLIGPKTLRQVKLCRRKDNLFKAINCLQGAFYIELTERRAKDRKFINGWLANRVS